MLLESARGNPSDRRVRPAGWRAGLHRRHSAQRDADRPGPTGAERRMVQSVGTRRRREQ